MSQAPPGDPLRGDGRVWVDPGFEGILREGGLVSFDDFMEARGAEKLRQRGYASNARFRLDGRDFYLKTYRFPRLSVALRGALKGNPARYSGLWELKNIQRFQKKGIATCVPVAAGDRREGSQGAGFILTEGLHAEASLEELVPRRYAPPLDRERALEKRRLTRALGEWIRGMHEASLHVRDLYLCHIWTDPAEPGVRFRLIDLHRAQAGGRVGERRIVRDLAALHHSAPLGLVTRADRLRALLAATGRRRLDERTKRLARAAAARADRMGRHEKSQGVLWSLIHAGVPPLR